METDNLDFACGEFSEKTFSLLVIYNHVFIL